jgi:putative copper export protein
MIWLDWAITATRFINFAAAILLAAVAGFFLLANSFGYGRWRPEFFPVRLVLSLEVVAWLAQAMWLIELLCSVCGELGWDQVGESEAFLGGTQFGKIGLWRCGLLLGLIAYRGFRFFGQKRSLATENWFRFKWLSAIETTIIFGQLALLAWFSHAAAGTGPWGWIQLGNDLLHLVGAALWPGGLVPLWWLLGRPVSEDVKRDALLRFSNVAVVVAPLVGATGVLSAYFRMHDLAPLFTTDYGRYVLLKMGCFLLLIALGAVNRFRLIPALVNPSSEISETPADWRKLRRNVLIEQSLFVVILFAVARLGVLAPPR